MEKKPYLIRCQSCKAKNRIPADKVNQTAKCGKCHIQLDLQSISAPNQVMVTDRNFESEVIGSQLPVIVVFWATWCSACRALLPIIDRIAFNSKGRIKVAKVNSEQNQATAARFRVMSLPTTLIFDNGQVKDSFVGAMNELQILSKLSRFL